MSFIERARVQFRDSNLINSAREYLSSRDNRTKIVLFVLVAFVAIGMFFRRFCCSGPNLDGSRIQRSGSSSSSTSSRTSSAAGIGGTNSNTYASRINIPIPSAVLNAFETYGGTHLQRCLQGFYIWRVATDGTHYQQSCHVGDDGRMLSERAGPASAPGGVGSMLDMKEVYRLVGQQNPSYMIHEEVRKFGVQNGATHYQRGPEGSFYVCCQDNRGNPPMRYRVGFFGQEFGMFPGAETILAKPGQPYNYSALDGVGPVLTAEQVYLRYGRPTLPATSSSSSTNTIEFGSWSEDELILTSSGVKSKTSSQNVPIPQAVLNVGFSINATHYQRASEEYCLGKGVNPIFFVWYTSEGHETRIRIEMDQNGNPTHQGLFQTAFVLPTSVSIEDNVFNQQVSTGPLLTAEEAYNTYGQPTPPVLPESLVPPLHVTETPPEGNSLSSSAMEPGSSSTSPAEPQYDGSIPQAVARVGKGLGAIGYQYGREGFVNVTTQHLVNSDLVSVREINLHGRVLALYDSPKDRYDESCREIGLHHVDARTVHEQYPDDVEEKGETDPVDIREGMIKLAERYKPTYFQAAPSGQHYYLYMIEKDSTHVVYLHQDEDISDTANGCYLNIQPGMLRSTLNVPGYPLIAYEDIQKHRGSKEDRKPQPRVSSNASNSVLYYQAVSTPNYTKADPRFFGGVMASLSSSSSNLQSAPLEFHTESTDVYVRSLPEVRDNILHGSDGADHSSSDQGSTSSSSSSSSSTSEPASRLITKEWIEQQKARKISGRKSIEGRLPKNYDEAKEIIEEERKTRAPRAPQAQNWIVLKAGIVNRKPQKLVKQASVSLLPTSSSSSSSDHGQGSV